jgi:hypothetical protein
LQPIGIAKIQQSRNLSINKPVAWTSIGAASIGGEVLSSRSSRKMRPIRSDSSGVISPAVLISSRNAAYRRRKNAQSSDLFNKLRA